LIAIEIDLLIPIGVEDCVNKMLRALRDATVRYAAKHDIGDSQDHVP